MAKAIREAEGATQEAENLSVAAIAATLLKQPEEAETTEEETDTGEIDGEEEASDRSESDEDEDESPTSGTDEDEEGDVPDSDADEDLEEEDEDYEQEEGDETDYLDVTDDDLISVKVDDEEQEVSIGELKRNYSLGRATEKRLQEATELRKAAHAEQTKALEDFAAQTQMLDSVFDGLDDTFFKGIIPEPNPAMRQSNPEAYLRHKEAYDQEQAHIADARKLLKEKQEAAKNARAEALKEYGKKSAEVIAKFIPELTDKKTSGPVFEQMAQMAQAYGYTAPEIQSALDPRMFIMVRDLVKYHALLNKTKGRDIMANEGQGKKKVRRLRSGNTKTRQRVRAADKQAKEAKLRAQKSGKTKDIAATLLVPAPKG